MNENTEKLVLNIDDSVDNCLLLTTALEGNGFSVISAENGRAALSLLAELSKLPDLIFLDAQMPVMDGYEFRREQSQCERIREIPVVVMSADCSHEMHERMNHPKHILTKSLSLNIIVERAVASINVAP